MSPDEPARGRTLLNAGRGLGAMGGLSKAETYVCEAVELFLRSGAIAEQADAMLALSGFLGDQGKIEEGKQLLDEARVLLEPNGPSPQLARTYYNLSGIHSLHFGTFHEGLNVVE